MRTFTVTLDVSLPDRYDGTEQDVASGIRLRLERLALPHAGGRCELDVDGATCRDTTNASDTNPFAHTCGRR